MAVPKKKTSKSKRGLRRSHDSLRPINIVFDPETGAAKLPHHISEDGMYKGTKVIKEKQKAPKAEENTAPEPVVSSAVTDKILDQVSESVESSEVQDAEFETKPAKAKKSAASSKKESESDK